MRAYRLSVFVVCSVLFFLFSGYALAQSGSFTVRPAKVELTGAPGETVETFITLENGLDIPATFSVSFEDVAGSDDPDDAVTLLGAKRGPYPLRDLLRGPKTITLAVGGERRIPISVVIPPDASPGGLYGSAIFTPVRQKNDGNVIPDSRIGVLLFLRIDGRIEEKGEVTNFSFSQGRFVFGKPPSDAEVLLTFSNTGTVHLNPYGEISILPMIGKAQSIPIDPWYVLPKSVRNRSIPVGDMLGYGYQRVALTLHGGYEEHTDTRTLHVIILPSLRSIGIVLALLAVLLYFILRRGKHLHV
jgi:hypothetical protein